MARLSKAEDKWKEAIDMLRNAGVDPLNYALSYVMGFMDSRQQDEFVREFESKKVTVTLSDHRPTLTLIKGGNNGETDVSA